MLVRVAPTPLVPATSRSLESSKLEPDLRFEKIISGIHSLCLVCFLTGIPPLSNTIISDVSKFKVTFISFSFLFLRCSSTELDIISSNNLINPGLYVTLLCCISDPLYTSKVSVCNAVEPIYIPGRFSTCSRSVNFLYLSSKFDIVTYYFF